MKHIRQIEMCGRSTQILKNESNYYQKLYKCKNIECEICSKDIRNKLINQINYYTNEYNLNRFFTLTTTKDYEILSKAWAKIRLKIEELNEEIYIKKIMSRKKEYDEEKAEAAYNKHIERIIEYELNCYYLFEYEGNKYKNYNNIGIRITDLIMNNELEESKELNLLPREKRHIKKRMKDNQSKYKKKFKHMNPKEKFNFFNEYKELFFAMINTGKDNVEKRRKIIKERVLKNTDKHEFEYVWFLEFQKNGAPHIHALSNYYFNYYSIHSAWTEDTNITKDINLDDWEDNGYKSDKIAEYVTKYLTKDTIETQKKIKTSGKKVSIMGSSKKLKINLDYPIYELEEKDKIKDLQHIEILKYKIPPKTFGKIDVPILQFKAELKSDEILKKNEHLELIHKKFKDIEKEIEDFNKESYEEEKKRGISLLKERREFKKDMWEMFNEYKNIESIKLIAKEITKRNKTIKIEKVKEISSDIDPVQKEFIEAVLDENYNIIMLNGKAGTGKSTSVKYLLDTINVENLSVEVVSFTGKASAVIGEITNLEGKTIHRLAQAKNNNLPDFIKGENNLLETDIIIIDEISMCDVMTFASLLNSLKPETKIILIGDKNQLNPIKSNNVIKLLEEANLENVKTIELEKNHRSNDKINKLAMSVLEGKVYELKYESYDEETMHKLISEGYQILSNTNNMNHNINTSISKTKKDIRIGKYVYNINDEVMAVKNDKAKKVFNGDILEIINYDEEYIYLKNIKNNKEVRYNLIDANSSIKPSTSITIHKSQGSEYEKVGIVLENKSLLLTNNLLYTAITRAKSEVIIFITDPNTDINLLKEQSPEPYNISLRDFI